jgi:hypothetical protein
MTKLCVPIGSRVPVKTVPFRSSSPLSIAWVMLRPPSVPSTMMATAPNGSDVPDGV